MELEIRRVSVQDVPLWAELAAAVYGDGQRELEDEFRRFLEACGDCKLSELPPGSEMGFLCFVEGVPAGFMNLSVRREYVEGRDEEGPIGYVEGIAVLPEYRRKGIGKRFVEYAVRLCRENGIKQLASDCSVYNRESELFHLGAGFKETGRQIFFMRSCE